MTMSRREGATATTAALPLIDDRRVAEPTAVERIFAEMLANVLRVEHVAVDSHFFDDLGADSLIMAHFCARVRKQGRLPRVSMRDIYAHPTIGRLAAAFADAAPAPPKPAMEAPTPVSAREHFWCGALQALCFLAYSYAAVLGIAEGYQWVSAGATAFAIYQRLVLATGVAFLGMSVVPVAVKWVLVGRWKPGHIRLWSLDYLRFWVVKTLVRSSPAARLFIGTPLYNVYLRALGARVGAGAVIFSRRVPVCTDLLTIGAGAVIRKEATFNGYRAQAGRIELGAVTLGRDVFVGERSVLDIDVSMGDGAQLGHSSALLTGQRVPAGERWHGSPAQRTGVNYVRVPTAGGGAARRARYSFAALVVVLGLYLPLMAAGFTMAIRAASSLAAILDPAARGLQALGAEAVILSLILFFGLAAVGLLLTVAVSRVLGAFIKPDIVYPLYGFHDAVHRSIARIGRMRFFTFLFGDSSYIVHFLEWLGYRLSPVEQTGSNFGSEVMHANPSLSSVGTGTMVADGLILVNDEVSSSSFRVSRAAIGQHNFVGNDVVYPASGRTGNNVLLGTKVMVPVDGEIREGVGLLGAPCFEIPRTVERDSRFDHLRTGEALRHGLEAKTRYNVRTIGVFLVTRWAGVFVFALFYLAALDPSTGLPTPANAVYFALSLVASATYFALVHRAVEAARPVQPTICSIYHEDFWSVERLWKLNPIHYFRAFDGTPFKAMLWRLMGVQVGRMVFDDGAHIADPSLTAIGDECVLNYRSKIQCHSQEDGTFKCDRTTLGSQCALGVGAFLLYDVTMGDGSAVDADSFLMKGEDVPAHARWSGNPAREA